MSFFARLYDQTPFWMVIVFAVGITLILAGCLVEWAARRREARDELRRYEPVEVPVTDRRPDEEPLPVVAWPPDVEPVAPKPKRANRRRVPAKRRHK